MILFTQDPGHRLVDVLCLAGAGRDLGDGQQAGAGGAEGEQTQDQGVRNHAIGLHLCSITVYHVVILFIKL